MDWDPAKVTPFTAAQLGTCEAGGHAEWSAADGHQAGLSWARCRDAASAAAFIPNTMLAYLRFPDREVPPVFGPEIDVAAYTDQGAYLERYWSQGPVYLSVARECRAGTDCAAATKRYVRELSALRDEAVNRLPVIKAPPGDPLSRFRPAGAPEDWVLVEAKPLQGSDYVDTECENGGSESWVGRNTTRTTVFWMQCANPTLAFQAYSTKWAAASDFAARPQLSGALGPGLDQAGVYAGGRGISRSWVQGSSYINVDRYCANPPFDACTEGSRLDAQTLRALLPGSVQPDTRGSDLVRDAALFFVVLPLLTLLLLFLPRWWWNRRRQSGYATGPTTARFSAVDRLAGRARRGLLARRGVLTVVVVGGWLGGLFALSPYNNYWLLAWFFCGPFVLAIAVSGLLWLVWRPGPLLRIASGPAGPPTPASVAGALLRALARGIAAFAIFYYLICTLMLLLVRSRTPVTNERVIRGLFEGGPLQIAMGATQWLAVRLDARGGYGLLFLAVLVAPITAAYLLDRLGRRLRRRSLTAVLDADTRPYFLYLRGFDEDRLRVSSSLTRRGFIESFTPFGRPRFEEVLVRYLSRFGPVIAISPRDQRVPDLGAAKLSLSGDAWQDRVREWVGGAQAVVMAATPSEVRRGLEWEIDYLAGVDTPRLMLVVAPWPRDELAARWRGFLKHAGRWPLFAPLQTEEMPSGVQLITWTCEEGWHGYGARRRWDWTYAASILSAVQDAEQSWTADREREEAAGLPGN
ncbi:hypothetical protein LVY72_02855 [Arthrobacter sp. I2-34]|uniref:Uncharacterized protein n=1 Tax=Arthrobacter hankyongi TaxID=2904801 RepID=A0ABS9L2E6_9MICC|nr:hypothetical protein [Arthrobacter hankyongi]MCG2620850.1 hypothetical protein [Arthrobacter hankyongi]